MSFVRRAIFLGLGMGIVPALALNVYHRPALIGIDFHTYAAAANVGLQNGWSRIYDQSIVATAQRDLVPWYRTQPFLSPPPVAWLVAPLQALPYSVAFDMWVALLLAALVFALAWSTTYTGVARVLAVAAALVPWWVAQAVMVGQVVPLVAVSILVAWRLLREDRDIAAGLVLAMVMLKPNTAVLAPIALMVAGRLRAFTTWAVAAAVIVALSLVTLGPHGFSAYVASLTDLPSGADHLTLHGTFGVTGVVALVARLAIVAGALVTAFRFRDRPGLPLAIGALASLLVAPYLHASDLCVFVAAGWIIWHELPAPLPRAVIAATLLMSTSLNVVAGIGPPLNRWLLFELLLAIMVGVTAWLPQRGMVALTSRAEFGRQATA
jgi:glycosyl transferase family 87